MSETRDVVAEVDRINALAAVIRKVDGAHLLGAAALAEAILTDAGLPADPTLTAEVERLQRRLWPSQGEEYANEVERQRVVIDTLQGQVERLRAQNAALTSALERTGRNLRLVVDGRPVRDMTENLAENDRALRVSTEGGASE
jgi:hypothetical protein